MLCWVLFWGVIDDGEDEMMIEGETLRECLEKASLSIPLEARKTCRAFQFEFEKKSGVFRKCWLEFFLTADQSISLQEARVDLASERTFVQLLNAMDKRQARFKQYTRHAV